MEPMFTQADSLNLDRLNAGYSTLQNQVSDGTLYAEEATQPLQEIDAERQALLQRKQAAQAHAQQQEAMMAAHQAAQAQSIQLANAQHSAENFTKTMPRFQDPDTGKTTYFYQSKPGSFEPLDHADEMQPADIEKNLPDSQPQKAEYVSTNTGTPLTDAQKAAGGIIDSSGTTHYPVPNRFSDAGQAYQSLQAAQTPTPEGAPMTGTQTIQNGPYGQQEVFVDGQHTQTIWPKDQQGKEIKPPWEHGREQSEQHLMSEGLKVGYGKAEIKQAMDQARMQVPPPFLTGNRAHDAVALSKDRHDVAMAARSILKDYSVQRQAAAADKRKIEAEDRKAKAEAEKKQNDEHATKWQDAYRHHLAEIEKQNKDKDSGKMPTQEAMELEAKRRADRDHLSTWGKLPSARQEELKRQSDESVKVETKSASGAAAPAASTPAPAAVPAGLKNTPLSAIQAELQKRAQANQPPGVLQSALESATRERERMRAMGVQPPSKFD